MQRSNRCNVSSRSRLPHLKKPQIYKNNFHFISQQFSSSPIKAEDPELMWKLIHKNELWQAGSSQNSIHMSHLWMRGHIRVMEWGSHLSTRGHVVGMYLARYASWSHRVVWVPSQVSILWVARSRCQTWNTYYMRHTDKLYSGAIFPHRLY